MSDRLNELIERARHHKMTPREAFEQRVSFIYGQQDYGSPHQLTKDQVRERLREMGYGPGADATDTGRQST